MTVTLMKNKLRLGCDKERSTQQRNLQTCSKSFIIMFSSVCVQQCLLMYVHILYKFKHIWRFNLNYLPLTMLKRNCCKQRSWHSNRKTKWCDLKIYRLLPLVMKYYCTKFKSCIIKSVLSCHNESVYKFGGTDWET